MTTRAAAIRIGSVASEDWNAWALPWNVPIRETRLAHLGYRLLDRRHGLAERDALRQVEASGHRRKLALMR